MFLRKYSQEPCQAEASLEKARVVYAAQDESLTVAVRKTRR